jgi:phage-related DNA helicase
VGKFKTLVLDELSGYKSKSSLRWKTANKMRSHVANCWGLTGTPTPNSLLDLWAQVALLDRGVSLGRSFAAYRQRYFYPASVGFKGYATSWAMVRGADVLIYDLISDFCLSMQTEGRIKLPPVTENTVEVTLPAGARRMYDRMKRDMVVEVQSGAVHSAATAAVMVGKLSQMTAGFIYPDVDEFLSGNSEISHVHSEKTRALVEIFEGTNSPLLVFYRFKAELEAIKNALPAGVVYTPKDKGVFDKWNRGEVPVLAAHPAAIGHGLNLQAGGHTVVWMTLPWSTEEWDQANKRLARQGQQNPVVIHKIMAKNTIDGVIEARLKQKETTQDAIMNYLQEF